MGALVFSDSLHFYRVQQLSSYMRRILIIKRTNKALVHVGEAKYIGQCLNIRCMRGG